MEFRIAQSFNDLEVRFAFDPEDNMSPIQMIWLDYTPLSASTLVMSVGLERGFLKDGGQGDDFVTSDVTIGEDGGLHFARDLNPLVPAEACLIKAFKFLTERCEMAVGSTWRGYFDDTLRHLSSMRLMIEENGRAA